MALNDKQQRFVDEYLKDLNATQAAGQSFFLNNDSFAFGEVFKCQSCHRIDPQGNAQYGVAYPGFFGTDGEVVPSPVVRGSAPFLDRKSVV